MIALAPHEGYTAALYLAAGVYRTEPVTAPAPDEAPHPAVTRSSRKERRKTSCRSSAAWAYKGLRPTPQYE